MSKYGKIIIPFGVVIERHEIDTAKILISLGHDVIFLVPVGTKGIRTPDIEMNGRRWEIKCPTGSSKRTIENLYRSAEGQSENLIFNIRGIKLSESVAISIIRREFDHRIRKIKRIIIITKDKKIIDISRNK